MNIKIVIATHKKYRMPEDELYLPLHVGAAGKESIGYQRDDEGENISSLNPKFCELTGLYWAWKNLDSDYIGLAHYRRHFVSKRSKDAWKSVLGSKDIMPYLGKVRVFVPKRRRYYIESLYSHYAHTLYAEQLDVTHEIIGELFPDYLASYDRAVNKTSGYMFNMMIMDKELLNEYCEWLFEILFEIQNRIDDTNLSTFHKRFYGRVSEIIFNVWLDKKLSDGAIQASEVKELPYVHMEEVNWWKKGTAFIKAKFLGKKYEGSF